METQQYEIWENLRRCWAPRGEKQASRAPWSTRCEILVYSVMAVRLLGSGNFTKCDHLILTNQQQLDNPYNHGFEIGSTRFFLHVCISKTNSALCIGAAMQWRGYACDLHPLLECESCLYHFLVMLPAGSSLMSLLHILHHVSFDIDSTFFIVSWSVIWSSWPQVLKTVPGT